MKVQDFVSKYSGAPLPLDEIAEKAERTDDPDLAEAASVFLEALEGLRDELDRLGFEIG